jgi:hypothetical protein
MKGKHVQMATKPQEEVCVKGYHMPAVVNDSIFDEREPSLRSRNGNPAMTVIHHCELSIVVRVSFLALSIFVLAPASTIMDHVLGH